MLLIGSRRGDLKHQRTANPAHPKSFVDSPGDGVPNGAMRGLLLRFDEDALYTLTKIFCR